MVTNLATAAEGKREERQWKLLAEFHRAARPLARIVAPLVGPLDRARAHGGETAARVTLFDPATSPGAEMSKRETAAALHVPRSTLHRAMRA